MEINKINELNSLLNQINEEKIDLTNEDAVLLQLANLFEQIQHSLERSDLLPQERKGYFLPQDFQVYVLGDGSIVNHPWAGGKQRTLPTFDDYLGADGGYVAIYTRDAEKGVYSVGDGIYVVGQVRIKGQYEGRIFIPEGYKSGDDITRDPEILKICEKYFTGLGDFWVGGDTGGWFGIQL